MAAQLAGPFARTLARGRSLPLLQRASSFKGQEGWNRRTSPAAARTRDGAELGSACCLIPNFPGEPYLVTALGAKQARTGDQPSARSTETDDGGAACRPMSVSAGASVTCAVPPDALRQCVRSLQRLFATWDPGPSDLATPSAGRSLTGCRACFEPAVALDGHRGAQLPLQRRCPGRRATGAHNR